MIDPTLVTIAIFIVFIVWFQSGEFVPWLVLSTSRRRDAVELGILIVLLLAAPFFPFNIAWFTGWVSPYLVVCLLAPLVIEGLLRRRNPAAIGLRRPEDQNALALVGALVVLFIISRVLGPVVRGGLAAFDWRRFLTVSLLLPFLEEVMFRGMIQTRLQSLIKGDMLPWIFSGLFFGLYHGYVQFISSGGVMGIAQLLQIGYLICFGMLMGLIYRRTRSLLPGFLVHALNNFSL